MKVKIDVTEQDILCGKKGEAESCPIALAIRRRIAPDCYVTVLEKIVISSTTEKDYVYIIRNPVFQWVRDYDNDLVVMPTSFEVKIPDKFLLTAGTGKNT